MTSEPQLFRVNPENRATDRIEEVNFSQLGLRERCDIQEWVAANPGILGENLLVVSKEFSGFDRTNERLDLLAVDQDGKLVVIELKRDDSGADVHWQAIKYASYLNRAGEDAIVGMLARHEKISKENAADRLTQHLGGDDLNALNSDQRIILASHRFAPEVTSAALWLNEKALGESLITCVKLTPHRDADTDTLYVQAATIIPLPGADELDVNVGDNVLDNQTGSGNNFAANLRKAYARNKDDEVTHFLRKVRNLAITDLPGSIQPDRRSKWAGGTHNRYYHFWYRRQPWSNWGLSYRVNLYPQDEPGEWSATVEIGNCTAEMKERIAVLSLHDEQIVESSFVRVEMGTDTLNHDFAERISEVTRRFIEQITPVVDSFEEESNEEGD